MSPSLLGVDIGGTKVALAVAEPDGRIIVARRMPTEVELGPEEIVKKVIALGRELLTQASTKSVAGIGIGCGGPLDLEQGLVLSPPNLPGWDRFPLRAILEKEFGCKAVLDNDANAAALGEYQFGAGRRARSLAYLTISTGIGGGIILDGQLLHGVAGSAGEVGHQTILPNGPKCNCGSSGCLEALASGTAIARRARERLSDGRTSLLRDWPGGDLNAITAQMVADAARQRDAVAAEIWQETAEYLAMGIGNIISILAPEIVILGGGVAQAGEQLLAPVRTALKRLVFLVPLDMVKVVGAELGGDSGLYGAVSLAREAATLQDSRKRYQRG